MSQISHTLLVLLSFTTAIQCMVIEPNPDNAIPQFTSTHAHWRRHRRQRHNSNNRRHQRHHKNSIRHRQLNDLNEVEPPSQVTDMQFTYSPRVVLSPHKPLLPPVALLEPPEDDMDDFALAAVAISRNSTEESPQGSQDHSQGHTQGHTQGHAQGHAKGRSKRSLDFVHVPVCDSVSEWVERHEARNMWGHKVEVLQEIDIGGARVNQYFYETKCREEKSACVGIDTQQFYSVCKNKHVWAYAKIRTSAGDEGWNLIKIPGSCNCALFKKKVRRVSLLDLLQDMR
uniref:Neurotrophin n=1 Tax=Platynereis dumerilii TaxID=6359 RepID=A0A165V923_PLADU|nr:neurotrophin [Platynereis dumerilii]